MENNINQIIQFIHSQAEQWNLNNLLIGILFLRISFYLLIVFIKKGMDDLGLLKQISIIISIAAMYLIIIAIYKVRFL